MGAYGGGGFIPNPAGGQAFDEDVYVDTIPPLFEYVRSKVGNTPKLCHDVHSHLSGINAVEFSRRMQPYQMFFIEDVLSPEQLPWYKQIRQTSTTPQAVGELFTHPFEYLPLISDRLIDFVRCRVSSIGGITPAKKLEACCEPYGVRTAFQEGGDNDPVNQIAAYHVDISHPAFGIQEENHFPDVAKEVVTGAGEIRKGSLYGNDKPGLGIDVNEALAAKYPLQPAGKGYEYPLDRAMDGTVVKP
jgi:mannonate dehydratase